MSPEANGHAAHGRTGQTPFDRVKTRTRRAAFRRTTYDGLMAEKTARLDLRLAPGQKALVEQAAALNGSTVAGYAVAQLVEAASAAVARSRTLVLDPGAWEDFLAALDAPDDEAFAALRDTTPVWEQ